MLVLGDLACPNVQCAKELKSCMEKSGLFKNKVVLCNLEGMIRDDEPYSDEKLFNHSEVLRAFESSKTVFSIANNHTYDYPTFIENTENLLKKKGFFVNGAIIDEDIQPTIIKEGEVVYAIFTHCWRVYTKTNPNQVNDKRINDCSYETFFETVKHYIDNNIDNKVVCFFHWNYDMETIPFPAYRKLARDLIDIGVYAVFGNHSHVPQGAEFYKERVIVYGLGNFYIPSGCFFDGKLTYPETSKKMLVVELQTENDAVLFHWFKTDVEEALTLEKTETQYDCATLMKYSPYARMDEKEYLKFFKRNRVKKTLVPVFRDYKGNIYDLKECAAITRIKIVKLIKG